MNESTFTIGRPTSERVTVRVTNRKYADCDDYWDGNWLAAEIEIVVGAFRGAYQAALRAEEFKIFREHLVPLYEKLSGEAGFASLEDWLSIKVCGDGKGHFIANCFAMDDPGVGNRLEFHLEFDQTELPAIVRGLEQISQQFPVKGHPEG